MTKIAVITDTDSSLPVDLAAQYHIIQVPITIHFGQEVFTTGLDIDDRSLFERIDRSGQFPTTSAPPPSAFSRAFEKAFADGADSIVCITVSSHISSTYSAACTAAEEFAGKKITIIDSLCVSLGQGLMVLAAAKAAAADADHDSVVAIAESYYGRIQIYGALSTLKYLAMGGRVSKLSAGMANMLDIRPILRSNQGKLELLEKVRTRRNAMDRLVELVKAEVAGKQLLEAAFTHINNPEDAAILERRLRAELPMPEQAITAEFTPGLSVHGGTGLIGVVIITAEKSS